MLAQQHELVLGLSPRRPDTQDSEALRGPFPSVEVLGRYDHVTPPELAVRYFDSSRAPCKNLVWFGQSAHNAPFEEPNAFE